MLFRGVHHLRFVAAPRLLSRARTTRTRAAAPPGSSRRAAPASTIPQPPEKVGESYLGTHDKTHERVYNFVLRPSAGGTNKCTHIDDGHANEETRSSLIEETLLGRSPGVAFGGAACMFCAFTFSSIPDVGSMMPLLGDPDFSELLRDGEQAEALKRVLDTSVGSLSFGGASLFTGGIAGLYAHRRWEKLVQDPSYVNDIGETPLTTGAWLGARVTLLTGPLTFAAVVVGIGAPVAVLFSMIGMFGGLEQALMMPAVTFLWSSAAAMMVGTVVLPMMIIGALPVLPLGCCLGALFTTRFKHHHIATSDDAAVHHRPR